MLKITKNKGSKPVKVTLAAIAVVGSLSLVVYQYNHTYPFGFGGRPLHRSRIIAETDDGRQLLWAHGPRDVETGEWFDITGSPLSPGGYQFGIGKDSIPAIDHPEFVGIHEREKLRAYDIDDETTIIGYVHHGEAKAYPIMIMNRHELVNDMVGGKPVTVGW